MGVLLQISAWAVTTIAADYTFHRYLCPKDTKIPIATVIAVNEIEEPKKVVQTMAWQIASQPNSLLFDFSGLGIDRQQIFDVLHSNLSPLVTAGVKISSDNANVMEITLQSTNVLLLKQTRSILKHRGMKLIKPSIYLLPTSTLSHDPQTLYWVVRIFHLPLDATLLLDQDQHRKKLAEAVTNSFNQSAITVKPKNIFYETVTRLSNTIYTGTVSVLMEEDVFKKSVITAQRRFVYLSFYKHHFEIDIKSL
ncbi:hypothetical protein INT47_012400 [Mucor saturninus]|uniref:Uncharacterized protein n=1 Tax=Mucor saturninus TaxID=64648 RepID=A0A8H7QP50_9FUNG|nr:hypothetical protein INT47_012400 [Mucor saturninus]